MKRSVNSGSQLQNFAVVGPFDIENYGDHLFEHILLQQIDEKFPGSRVDVFSVYGGPHGFNKDGLQVFSIDSLGELCSEKDYSAIFIAGGSVIHFHTLVQDVRGVMKKYPMWKLWTTASYAASTYAIPLLWNSPEAPFEFKGWEKLAAKSFVQTVDYLSVRDEASRNSLLDLGASTPIVNDDSGMLFASFAAKNNLAEYLPEELDTNDTRPIAVFHCNQNFDTDDMNPLLATLRKVGETFRVVLLPLAYTNREQDMLHMIYKSSNESFVFINRTLTFNEICSIFVACKLYMGLSFHGAISTYCSGGEIVAFDYEKRRKTEQLYERLGKRSNYTNDIGAFNDAVERCLSHGTPPPSPATHDIEANLHKHFEKMLSHIYSEKAKEPHDISTVYSAVLFEMAERVRAETAIQSLSEGYAECYRQYTELRKQLNPDAGD